MGIHDGRKTTDVIADLVSWAQQAHAGMMQRVQNNCSQFCHNLSSANAVMAQLGSRPRQAAVGFASITQSSSQAAAPTAGLPAASAPQAAAASGRISKEQVGRASWTFLHALAAQYPDKPTRQQKRDVHNLVS